MIIDINGNQYDAFADVATADDYLAGDVQRGPAWSAITDPDEKGRGLVSATRLMLTLPWVGEVPDPSVDQLDPIPTVAAMLAADLVASPELFADASGNSNVKTVKAGSVDIEFFTPVQGGPPIPRRLWDMLAQAGLVSLDALGDTTIDQPFYSGGDYCRPEWGRWPWDFEVAIQDYD